MIPQSQIDNNFTYHSPSQEQSIKYVKIRRDARDLVHILNELCPDSREKSLAVTKLEEAVFWANASIARNE